MFEELTKKENIRKVDIRKTWEYLVNNFIIDIPEETLELYFKANSEKRVQELILFPEVRRRLWDVLIEIDDSIVADRPGKTDLTGMTNSDLNNLSKRIDENSFEIAQKITKETFKSYYKPRNICLR